MYAQRLCKLILVDPWRFISVFLLLLLLYPPEDLHLTFLTCSSSNIDMNFYPIMPEDLYTCMPSRSNIAVNFYPCIQNTYKYQCQFLSYIYQNIFSPIYAHKGLAISTPTLPSTLRRRAHMDVNFYPCTTRGLSIDIKWYPCTPLIDINWYPWTPHIDINWYPCTPHFDINWYPCTPHFDFNWYPCTPHIDIKWYPCTPHIDIKWYPCSPHIDINWYPCTPHIDISIGTHVHPILIYQLVPMYTPY